MEVTLFKVDPDQVPIELAQVDDLVDLYIDSPLKQMCPEIFKFKLARLTVKMSLITRLPRVLFNVTSLTYLNLVENQIRQVPLEIKLLINLTYLNLSVNQIAGTVDLHGLPLRYLFLQQNRITRLLIDSCLNRLDFSYNRIIRWPKCYAELISCHGNPTSVPYLETGLVWCSQTVSAKNYNSAAGFLRHVEKPCLDLHSRGLLPAPLPFEIGNILTLK